MQVQNPSISQLQRTLLEQTQVTHIQGQSPVESPQGEAIAKSIVESQDKEAVSTQSAPKPRIRAGASAIATADKTMKAGGTQSKAAIKQSVLDDIDKTHASAMNKYDMELRAYEQIGSSLLRLKEGDVGYEGKLALEKSLESQARNIATLVGLKQTLSADIDSLLEATSSAELSPIKEKLEASISKLDEDVADDAVSGIKSLISQVSADIEQAEFVADKRAFISSIKDDIAQAVEQRQERVDFKAEMKIQRENLAIQITSAFSAKSTNMDVLALCDTYIEQEQTMFPQYSTCDLLTNIGLGGRELEQLTTMLNNRDAMPTEGLKSLYSLVLQMDGYQNTENALTQPENLEIFNKAISAEASNDERQLAWNVLDNEYISNPILSPILEAVKADFIQGDNPEQVTLLHDQHLARQAVNQFYQCYADQSLLPSVSNASSDVILALLSNLPQSKDGEPLDFYACDVYMQLARLENPNISDEECIAKLPESLQVKAQTMLDTWGELGITSSTQLEKTTQILVNAQLNRITLSLLLDTFNNVSPTKNTEVARKTVNALASTILNVNSTQDFDDQTILSLCAKKLGVELAVDEDLAKAINVIAKEGMQQGIAQTLLDQEKEIMSTLQSLQQKEKQIELRGERFAYSMISLQQILVRDVSELSAYDKTSIGLTDEIIQDTEKFQAFAKEYIENNPQSSWIKSVVCRSYQANKGTLSEADEQLVKNFTLDETSTRAIITQLDLTAKGATVHLASGITHSGKSDVAGRLFRNLARANSNSTRTSFEGIESFTINGKQFAVKNEKSVENPREALLALLNAESVTVTTKKGTETQDFTNPIASSHALIRNRATSLTGDDAKSGTKIIDHALSKTIIQSSNESTSKLLNNLQDNLKNEFNQTASMASRINNLANDVVSDITQSMYDDSNFSDKIVPLVMNIALAQTNTTSQSFFVETATHKPLEILGAIVQGLDPSLTGDAVQVVAQSIINNKDKVNLSSAIFTSAATLAHGLNTLRINMEVPLESRNALNAFTTAQTAMTTLQALTNNTSLELNAGISVGVEAEVSAGFASLEASVKLGATNGMTLWRDENGAANLNISSTLLANAGIGASFAGIASINIEGEVSASDNLRLSFANDKACAEFVGLFLTGQAEQGDLKLASKVYKGESFSVGGSVSAQVGNEIELPDGVCTVGAMAGVSLAGAVTYHTEVSGTTRTTTSEHSYDFNANLTLEATAQSPGHAGIDTAKSIIETEGTEKSVDASVGFGRTDVSASATISASNGEFSASAVAELSYNNNATEKTVVATDLSGKNISSISKTTSQLVACSDTMGAVTSFLSQLGVEPSSRAFVELQAFLEANPLSSFSISVTKSIPDSTVGSLMGKSEAQKNATINDISQYTLSEISISYTQEAMSSSLGLLGIVSIEQDASKSVEKNFPVAV